MSKAIPLRVVNSYMKRTEANAFRDNYRIGQSFGREIEKPILPFRKSSGNPRPPPYRCVAEISVAPSIPSHPQASGTLMGPPASTQPRQTQMPASTRLFVPLKPPGMSMLARRPEGLGQ
nr:hypothetical protein L203_02419 [Cryptococcus depauperatus CBS 7841]